MKSFSWPEIKHCIYGLEQARPSRPLSYLSFALNYHFHGTDVFGYHVVNFIIHYLASVFLFLFIYNTLKLPRLKDQYENIAYPMALLATFFWAINPLWVTSVTYIVQRMASMAGLFYIMSMYFYLKARTNSKFKYSFILFTISLLSGLASVLTKENAAILPVSILLFDLFLIEGITRQSVLKYAKIMLLPVFVILIASFIYVDFSNILNEYKIRDFTMIERLLTQPRVILFYLSLLFYPISSRLTLLYDIEVSRSLLQPWTTIPSILLILFIIGFTFYIARKRPLISFCIIFYFLNHIIEGSIFNLELIYEHRNYLPSMLLFVPLAEFIIYIIDYFSYKIIFQFIVALGVVIILFGEGDITYNRNKIVSEDFLLWFDNIDKSPGLSRPHANMGRIYFIYNKKEKALQEYKKAMILNNFGNKDILAIQQCNMGMLYFEMRQDDLAMDCFRKSSEILPEYIQTNIHMAKIKLRHNKVKEARQIVEDKLKKYRSDPAVMELYGLILLKDGQINASQSFARKLLAKDADSLTALAIMAETCRLKNNYTCAISYWKSVRLLFPQNALANLALIELYTKINNTEKLNQEIRLLLYLQKSLTLNEYIKKLTKDENLIIYVPKIENYSFMTKQCSYIN
jgi:Tfp pilus assembly protein PilF